MSIAIRIAALSVPLLLIFLTIIACYAYSQIINLHLPISNALGLLTIFLPIITGLSTRVAQNLLLGSSRREQSQLTIPVVFILGFQLIYETVIVTLALTNIILPSSLDCGLKEKWQLMFRAKNENAIRTIQDRFECCGLMTTKHQPWPFPDKKHTVTSCTEMYGRSKSCLGDWRKSQQFNAGLFLIVAVLVFIAKVGTITFLTTGTSWSQNRSWVDSNRRSRNDAASRGKLRRLIDGGENGAVVGEEAYRDDVERIEDVNGPGRDDVGPRVVASGIGPAEGGYGWGESAPASVAGAA